MAFQTISLPDRIVTFDENAETSRVLIVDDHLFLAESLAYLLRQSGLDAAVSVGSAVDEILAEATSFSPDLVLLDLMLAPPIGSGSVLIEPLRRLGPIVVMLTGVEDRIVLAECLEQGADGIIYKAQPAVGVLEQVQRTLRSGECMSGSERFALLRELRLERERLARLMAPIERLTEREVEVLELLAEGLAAADIAERTFVSVSTVRSHIRSILTKLGVHSQLAAVALARHTGRIS